MSARLRVTSLWLALIVLLSVFLVTNFKVTTDISAFLPRAEDSLRSELVREVASGKLSRRMILSIEVPEDLALSTISTDFEAALRADRDWIARIESFEGGSGESHDEALWSVYGPRWPYLYAASLEAADARLSDAGLHEAAGELLAQLQGPMSALVSRIAPSDPFLVLPSVFEGLASSQAGSIARFDGRYATEDGRYAIFFLSTHAGAFENAAQAPVLEGIRQHFAQLNDRYDGRLTLEMSGVNRISIASQEMIESDIRRISILSTLVMMLLLFSLFRGPRVALLAMMTILTGVLAALSVSMLLFGRVHGISLAFGASLIGLAVDYIVHLYSHHAEAPDGQGPQQTLKEIWPALRMAASTALVGFFVLGYSGFPGLREVAVFAVVGLSVALATLRYVVVLWMPETIAASRIRSGLADGLAWGFVRLYAAPRVAWAFMAVVLLVLAVGLPRVEWSGSLVDAGRLDGPLTEEEERVRARVSRFDQSRFIASYGADLEAALQSAEAVQEVLDAEEGVGGYASISRLLPSKQRQRALAERLQESSELRSRFEQAFGETGFRPEMFAPFYAQLEGELPEVLDAEMLRDTPLASLVDNFVVELEEGVAVLSFLYQVSDSDALAAALARVPGAVYIDQASMMQELGGAQRGRTLLIVILGLALICAALAWRYRHWRDVVGVLLPSFLAVALTWAILALLGQAVDLVTASASLMIVSLGVDYGVFLVDARASHGPRLRSSLLGIAVAGTTTLAGFGLLALSSYPLLFRIGLTAWIGVTAAMVLAPVSLIFVAERRA